MFMLMLYSVNKTIWIKDVLYDWHVILYRGYEGWKFKHQRLQNKLKRYKLHFFPQICFI